MDRDGEEIHLHLEYLRAGVPALTFALGGMLAEAAAVCLAEQGHDETCVLLLRQETGLSVFTLHRAAVSETMRRAYRDLQEATEFGGRACWNRRASLPGF